MGNLDWIKFLIVDMYIRFPTSFNFLNLMFVSGKFHFIVWRLIFTSEHFRFQIWLIRFAIRKNKKNTLIDDLYMIYLKLWTLMISW
jgi:hypothetical protein